MQNATQMQLQFSTGTSNLPEVIQSITDASSFPKRDYQTNNPHSIEAKSNQHNPKQLCDITEIYLDSRKTASTVNTLQVHAIRKWANTLMQCKEYTGNSKTIKLHAKSKAMPLSLHMLKDKSKVCGDFWHDFH